MKQLVLGSAAYSRSSSVEVKPIGSKYLLQLEAQGQALRAGKATLS